MAKIHFLISNIKIKINACIKGWAFFLAYLKTYRFGSGHGGI
ncbi:MAG: hypothetical protein WA102_05085 [Candidatus Methanoperedens sp.]